MNLLLVSLLALTASAFVQGSTDVKVGDACTDTPMGSGLPTCTGINDGLYCQVSTSTCQKCPDPATGCNGDANCLHNICGFWGEGGCICQYAGLWTDGAQTWHYDNCDEQRGNPGHQVMFCNANGTPDPNAQKTAKGLCQACPGDRGGCPGKEGEIPYDNCYHNCDFSTGSPTPAPTTPTTTFNPTAGSTRTADVLLAFYGTEECLEDGNVAPLQVVFAGLTVDGCSTANDTSTVPSSVISVELQCLGNGKATMTKRNGTCSASRTTEDRSDIGTCAKVPSGDTGVDWGLYYKASWVGENPCEQSLFDQIKDFGHEQGLTTTQLVAIVGAAGLVVFCCLACLCWYGCCNCAKEAGAAEQASRRASRQRYGV